MRYALVVDDEPIVANLLAFSLEQNGFTVEKAYNAEDARQVLDDFDADVALIDLHLGTGPSGFDLAHYIENHHEQTLILALSRYAAPDYIGTGSPKLPSSAGFLSKDMVTDPQVVMETIESVLAGAPSRGKLPLTGPLATLSRTQIQILRMLAQGYQPSEISRIRGTTRSATEQTISLIYSKLGIPHDGVVNMRTEAVRMYIESAGIPQRGDDE